MATLQCLVYLVLLVVVGNEAILSPSTETNRASAPVYKKYEIDNKTSKHESLQAQPSEEYGHHYPGPYGYGEGYNVHSSYAYGYHPNPHPPYNPSYAINSLLVPLAGVALLGAAAVFASNPVLLQLGVVAGKRKRRDTEQEELVERKLKDIAMLEKFMHQLPKASLEKQEKQILANYLSCSGLIDNSGSPGCLERLFCEVQHPDAKVTQLEREVLNIVMSEIFENEYVDSFIKANMLRARKVGHAGHDCTQFYCQQTNLNKL